MSVSRYFIVLGSIAVISTGVRADETMRLARLARPILSENCFQCHGPADQKGDLRLDEPNAAIVPGKPRESELIERIHETDPDEMMPPPEAHKTLSDDDKKLLEDWIASGAVYAPHWSFGPIADAKVKIDEAMKNRQGQAPSGRLIRRLALDLTGLPPSIDEVERFERGELTYEQLVDRYLASPHYGEHRARFWLDAARYSDTHGLQNDYFRAIWPYRQWVVDAFNSNLPFNEFSVRQLAGDLLPEEKGFDPIATGFLKCNPSTHEGGVIQEEYRVKYLMDRTDTVATTWLGLTAGCASCHDHKFDPLSTAEYYSLTAFFAGIEEPVMNGDRAYNGPVASMPNGLSRSELNELVSWSRGAEGDIKPTVTSDVFGGSSVTTFTGQAMPKQTLAIWVRPQGGQSVIRQMEGRGSKQRGWELNVDKDRHLLLRLLGDKEGALGKREFRSLNPIEPGKLVHIVVRIEGDSFQVYRQGEKVVLEAGDDDLPAFELAKRPKAESLLPRVSHLPVEVKILCVDQYDQALSDEQIVNLSQAPARIQGLLEKVKSVTSSLVAKEGGMKPSHVLIGGAYDNQGDEVVMGTPAILPPMPESFPSNRLGFARWLFLPEHPLTARVAVNRIWAQFFGKGLVKTQNDFGNQGDLPTHPELLDSLANDFRSDWNVKRLVRRIVLSETYRQSSAAIPGRDRAHRLRLDGEVLRDQALAVSGLLDRTVGGPPVSPYQPDGIWRAVSVDISDSKKYQQGTGSELYRRSLYTVHKRTAGPPIMSNFDAPSRQVCSVQREVTNTPLQALQLMNDTQFIEAARALAARSMKAPEPLIRMFKIATCRDPEPAELEVLRSLLKQFESADGKAFAKYGEFDAEVPGPYVMVATTILNTDEVLCR